MYYIVADISRDHFWALQTPKKALGCYAGQSPSLRRTCARIFLKGLQLDAFTLQLEHE